MPFLPDKDEKTTIVDNDILWLDDSESSFDSNKVKFSTIKDNILDDPSITTEKSVINDIINGAMDIWQREKSFVSPTGAYNADRFFYTSVSSGAVTITRSTDTPDQRFNYSTKIAVTTADVSVDAGDIVAIDQRIEGYNFKKYVGKYGSVGFYVKANKTGTYCLSFRNAGFNRSFIREYTITTNWTFIEIPPVLFNDQGGTWDYTNGRGIIVGWTLMAGSTWYGAADSWLSSHILATSNQVNFMDNTANEFYITGISFNIGQKPIDFSGYDIEKELTKCQRYYENTYDFDTIPGTASITNGAKRAIAYSATSMCSSSQEFKVTKRAPPSVVFYSETTGANGNIRNLTAGADVARTAANLGENGFRVDTGGLVTGNIYGWHWTADAEL